ncbi:MAG: RNase adapter RapZ [Acidobacteriaceae bacterium]
MSPGPKASSTRKAAARSSSRRPAAAHPRDLVILTGLSGSGKASALKAFEDLGFYAVDNMPVSLMPPFAELVAHSRDIRRAALVVDVREGQSLEKFPAILREIRRTLPTTVLFLEATRAALLARYSETRRPHPLGREERVTRALQEERRLLEPIRNVADVVLDTTRFNVHELRSYIQSKFVRESDGKSLLISSISFGYKKGLPLDADLVFDVRFLPNPHFVPEFRNLTGKDPRVENYIISFPQSREFLDRVTDLLLFLLPHYINEGKSYLTLAFGCTGGQHRSVMIAEEIARRVARHGFQVKVAHRDMPR